MYVSRIENSGMDALAALGIVLPITLIIQAFANLVGLGGAPRAGPSGSKPDFQYRLLLTCVAWNFHRRRDISLFQRNCDAVWLSAKRNRIRRFLPENLRLRNRICYVSTGLKSIYFNAGLLHVCHELGSAWRVHQHSVRPNFYLFPPHGCPGVKPCNCYFPALLLRVCDTLFPHQKEHLPFPDSGNAAFP